MLGIAFDHGEEGILIGVMETNPQPKAVGERDLFLDCFRTMDRGATFILDHIARHQMPAVGSGVEQDIGGPTFNAAIQHGFQRLVIRIFPFKGQIITEHQAATRPRAQKA